MTKFSIEAYLNPNLAPGSTTVTTAFTITAHDEPGEKLGALPRRVIGIVIDSSGSMDSAADSDKTIDKMTAAKNSARKLVDLIPEDVEFFVIDFASKANVVFPRAVATASNKAKAHKAIQKIYASGGTQMSYALRACREQVAGCDDAIKIVSILTDGDNCAGDRRDLERELQLCEGLFQAHCRGFGLDWNRPVLQPVSDALMGTIGLIATPDKLDADFQSILDSALGKRHANVRLRLWMPKVVKLASLKQMFPTELDLTEKVREHSPREVEFSLGAWGSESQDYQATFETAAREPDGMGTAICRPYLVHINPQTKVEEVIPATVIYDPRPGWGNVRDGVVEASWIRDISLTMATNSMVGHYQGEGEKSRAKQEFATAWDRGDVATATLRLQRVMQLAVESNDDDTKRMVRELADVDEATGTLQLRRRGQVDKAAVMDLDVGSTRTVRARRG